MISKDVIIATDAGREGELVARWILQMSGNKKPNLPFVDIFGNRQSNQRWFCTFKTGKRI